jgi:hypothetical protein
MGCLHHVGSPYLEADTLLRVLLLWRRRVLAMANLTCHDHLSWVEGLGLLSWKIGDALDDYDNSSNFVDTVISLREPRLWIHRVRRHRLIELELTWLHHKQLFCVPHE